jgi:hypothetical protein
MELPRCEGLFEGLEEVLEVANPHFTHHFPWHSMGFHAIPWNF